VRHRVGAPHEIQDQRQFRVRVAVEQGTRPLRYPLEEIAHLTLDGVILRELHDDAPAVPRIGRTPRQPARLEPIDDAGDRASREARQLGQPSGCHRPVAHDQVRALVVGRVQAQPIGDGLVKHDRPCAHLPEFQEQGGHQGLASGLSAGGGTGS
jgi:hypothetical protein